MGASRKALCTKEPLCFAIQAIAGICASKGAEPNIEHVAGVSNVWADCISRWTEPKGRDFISTLDPHKEIKVNVAELISDLWLE